MGLQWWSRHLLGTFGYKADRVAVIVDSFVGVLPEHHEHDQAKLMDLFHMCNAAVLTASQVSRCRSRQLTIQDIFEETMVSFPSVAFAHINSKDDFIQIKFTNTFETQYPFTMGEYYDTVNTVFRRYNKQPNWVAYLVDGTTHTFLGERWLLTTDATGPCDSGTFAKPLLRHWLTDWTAGIALSTVCSGSTNTSGWNRLSYCDRALQGKVMQLEG